MVAGWPSAWQGLQNVATSTFTVATGRTHRLGKGEGTEANPAWSPDGRRLYFTSSRYVHAVPSDQEIDFAMVKSTGVYMVDLPQDPARIVHEDLMSNATVVAIEPANIVQLNVRDDGIYYLSQPLSTFDGFLKGEKSALHRFDLDTEQDTVLAEDMDSYSLSLVGQKVLIKREVTTRCWMLRRDMLRKRNRG